MKRKVHRAFVEEVPSYSGSAWHATCHETLECGFGACPEFDRNGERALDRSVMYLNEICDADHVL